MDCETGEVSSGRINQADREVLREWLKRRFAGRPDVAFALEGCTGWRYVVEELGRAGVEAHLAEPADTAALKGPKRRAKTDKADARHLRQLLVDGRLPESWVAPSNVLEVRALGRLYIDMLNERRASQQRIRAQLYQQGVPAQQSVFGIDGRVELAHAALSLAGAQSVTAGLAMIDALTAQLDPLRAQLGVFARRQPGCRTLMSLYGVGAYAPIAWAEMGDTRRFSSSRHAVRHTGLDVTVYSSDGKRSRGHLARQGPPALRWALYEAAQSAAKGSSPDHYYYLAVCDHLGANRACLSVVRKLARRAYHLLRDLGDDAWADVA